MMEKNRAKHAAYDGELDDSAMSEFRNSKIIQRFQVVDELKSHRVIENDKHKSLNARKG